MQLRTPIVMLSGALLLAGCARTIQHGGAAPACMGRISADTRVFARDSVDIAVRNRRSPLIAYEPQWTMDRNHVVVLRFHVLPSGVADSASVQVISSTDPRFTSIAMRTVRRSSYWPACKDGEAVTMLAQQSFRYGGS